MCFQLEYRRVFILYQKLQTVFFCVQQGSLVTNWPPALPAMKEEESSEEEAAAAAPTREQDTVPAELDDVRTPEPLDDIPKHDDEEGSSPETSLPYKWVVEAANLLVPAVGSSFSEALDLIESVMLVPALGSGPRAPRSTEFPRGRASFC